MLPIVMRPVDKPFDKVTLIGATGREEVRRTMRLQCQIDLLEARIFRKAYTRLCISILACSRPGHKQEWRANELRSPAWSLSLPSLIVFHFVSETFDNLLYQESQCQEKAPMILLFVAQLMRTIEASWSSSCRRRMWSATIRRKDSNTVMIRRSAWGAY